MTTYERLRRLEKKRNRKYGAALEKAVYRQTAVVEDKDPRKEGARDAAPVSRGDERSAGRLYLMIFIIVFALSVAGLSVFFMAQSRALSQDFRGQMEELKGRLEESSRQNRALEDGLKKTSSALAGIEDKLAESARSQKEQYSRISELKAQLDAANKRLDSIAQAPQNPPPGT